MAFIAGYPEFPGGSWPDWDSRVPMTGDFIAEWMSGRFHSSLMETSSSGNVIHSKKLYFIWSLCQSTIGSQFPGHPIMATG